MSKNIDIKMGMEYRPCYVGNKKGLFHRWIDKDQVIMHIDTYVTQSQLDYILCDYKANKVVPKNCSTTVISQTFAIVEYEDGTVAEVEPTELKFADNNMREYAFNLDGICEDDNPRPGLE